MRRYCLSSSMLKMLKATLPGLAGPEPPEYGALVAGLARDFGFVATEKYFPTSKLREACRLFAKESWLGNRHRLLFYRVSADAMLQVLVECAMTPEARALGRRLNEVMGALDEPAAMLLRLAYIHGLNREAICRMLPADEVDAAAEDLEQHLEDLQDALKYQLLVRKGHYTIAAERERDAEEQWSLAEIVNRLYEAAEEAVRSERRPVSLTARDLVHEFLLHRPVPAPLNHYQALARARQFFRRRLTDRFRSARIQGRSDEDLSTHASPGPNAEELVDRGKGSERLRTAILELSKQYPRHPGLLDFLTEYYRDGGSLADKARKHGIPEGFARLRYADVESIVRESFPVSGS